ncbi:hypothetical protein A6302_03972 [Methylobrevis pamukkalensis]|uniref:Uncharacterized protein n=1 Tax=Methylobrevis pamukkalensis TaxID=1439726 RepID=A0A1E3GXG1_9HYPH|nr:hypothetical protein A6302_03972 [Methylobrevis pamukkalensis]
MAASTSAPTAPMAPPSVGVARPMKMVPSTRKISTSGGSSEVIDRRTSARPRSVRASGGSAGTSSGLKIEIRMMKPVYMPVRISAGTMAPSYMSPTERPSWSASTISTRLGGMIWASVPEAAMVPVAMRRS